MSPRTRLFLLLTLSTSLAFAQEPARAPMQLRDAVQDKNFFFLSLLERFKPLEAELTRDPQLARIQSARVSSIAAAGKCGTDLKCYTGNFVWTAAEIEAVEQSLRVLHRQSKSLRELAVVLRTSGMYQRQSRLADEDLLAFAWRDSAAGINRAISVYGEGATPRYPEIDSVAYDFKSDEFRRLVRIIVTGMLDEEESHSLFFQPSLKFALRLMEASKRDEAGRFEPLERGENAPAFDKVKSIRWADYPYSSIVVPGSGTDRLSWSLSQWGKERLRLAAKRYREGKAPFLIVSGGFVHPNQTPFAEALEMKKVLMADFGIPASAIIVDPHARHTTTNIRNAARLIWRYGLPFDKTALITTDVDQSTYIESPEFNLRCDRELGYQPHKLLARKSPFDLEFTPRLDSLQSDSTDLLDP